MSDRPRQVVDEVERRNIPFPLACHDGLAARLIGSCTERGIIDAHDSLHVVGLCERLRYGAHSLTTIERLSLRHLSVVLKKGVALRVSGRPARCVAIERTLATNPRGARGKRYKLGRC
ncbi:hypothetical protein D3C71_1868190 [compost metagenome]